MPTLSSTLTLVQDNVTAVAAASVNVPVQQIATRYDAHIAGTADLHPPSQILLPAIGGTQAISDAATDIGTRTEVIVSGVMKAVGGTGGFTTRINALPTDLTTLAASVGTLTTMVVTNASPADGVAGTSVKANRVVTRDANGLIGADTARTATSAASASGLPVVGVVVGNGSGVSAITVTNGGTGYTSAPTVTLAPPTIGTLAQATATVVGGVVTTVTVTLAGSGYTSAPAVTFTGGSGTGAAATTAITPVAAGGLASIGAGRYVRDTGIGFATSLIQGSDLPASGVPYATLQELSVTVDAASLLYRVAAGSYLNSQGMTVDFTATTLNPTFTPSTTATLYFAPYINDGGGLVTPNGVATAALAVVPVTGALALQRVSLPANATGIYPSQAAWVAAGSPAAKGYLLPRVVGDSTQNAGTSGSFAPTAAPYALFGADPSGNLTAAKRLDTKSLVVVGADTDFSASVDPMTLFGAGYAPGTLRNGVDVSTAYAGAAKVRTAPTDASLAQMLAGGGSTTYFTQPGTTYGTSGTAATMSTTSTGPLEINGRWYNNGGTLASGTTALTSNAISGGTAANSYTLYAVGNTGTGLFSLVLQLTTAAALVNSRPLRRFYWDSTSLRVQIVDDSPLVKLASPQIAVNVISATDGGANAAISTTTQAVGAGMGLVYMYVPSSLVALVSISYDYTTASTSGSYCSGNLYSTPTGGTGGILGLQAIASPTNGGYGSTSKTFWQVFATGGYTISMSHAISGANYNVYNRNVQIVMFNQ